MTWAKEERGKELHDRMEDARQRRRSRRTHATPDYRLPDERDIFAASSTEERWQEDWTSEREEETVPSRRILGKPQKKERRRDPDEHPPRAAAEQGPPSGPPQTKQQRELELHEFMRAARNSNTQNTYASGWREFVRWVTAVENPIRTEDAKVDQERPSETDVAAYCRYIVMEKGNTIGSAEVAISAIADHLRFTVTDGYNPCKGPVLTQMLHILKPLATPPTQKAELTPQQLTAILDRTAKENTPTSRRDGAMITLMFTALLRRSETVRMNKADVTWDTTRTLMTVYVDPMCKNDMDRKGHQRIFRAQGKEATYCVVQLMWDYIGYHKGEPDSPLFATPQGERLSVNTPNHRLKYWLGRTGVTDTSMYGSHSLRAGGATQAARAGVEERDIKQHGNWKSDAVRVYLRPNMEERLKTSDAIADALNRHRDHPIRATLPAAGRS